jgi:hypothetical protein
MPFWAGRRVTNAPVVYLCAEGQRGFRKRKVGIDMTSDPPTRGLDFHLIEQRPDLGRDDGDLPELIEAIERAGVNPGLIVIDTAAKSIGSADENGPGMAALINNADLLSKRFGCFVLMVHHIGHSEEAAKRPRGWSGLTGAIDVQILVERKPLEMEASLTIQEAKDEASGVQFIMNLSRFVIGVDPDGDEVSTLIVDSVVPAEAPVKPAQKAKTIPASQRLLMDCVAQAISEAGKPTRPFSDGPEVRAVDAEDIRRRYYARVAEQPKEDETKDQLAERQRKAFYRSLKSAIDAKHIVAAERDGQRLIWEA